MLVAYIQYEYIHIKNVCYGTLRPKGEHSPFDVKFQLNYIPKMLAVYIQYKFVFQNVHSPTLRPKGSQKPSNWHVFIHCWQDISNIYFVISIFVFRFKDWSWGWLTPKVLDKFWKVFLVYSGPIWSGKLDLQPDGCPGVKGCSWNCSVSSLASWCSNSLRLVGRSWHGSWTKHQKKRYIGHLDTMQMSDAPPLP